jgi:hypothetical protein
MATKNTNHLLGLLCIITGIAIIVFTLGSLLLKLAIGIMALSLINYGLKLRGLPPLQLLIPLMAQQAHRRRFF